MKKPRTKNMYTNPGTDMFLKVIPAFCNFRPLSYAHYCPLPLVGYRYGSEEIWYLGDKWIFLVEFQRGARNLRAHSSASQEYSFFLSGRGNQRGFSSSWHRVNEKIMVVLIICIDCEQEPTWPKEILFACWFTKKWGKISIFWKASITERLSHIRAGLVLLFI